MDNRRLFKAAQTGDVQLLHQLVAGDPLILHTSSLASSGNPLHIASAYGNVDFAKDIINRRPDLAQELNQDGYSPIHIASSMGHSEVVRELLKVDHKLCQLQGPEGKTPLHCAAIKGRGQALCEMLSVCSQCVEDVTVQNETALHLGIKNNQFQAIKVLVNRIREMKKENTLNVKDEQGNTVLHLATWKKQRQVIELLLGRAADGSRGLEVNAINTSGHTALDLLLIFPSEAGDREIEEILRSAGAMRTRDVMLTPIDSPQPCNQTSVNIPESAETNPRLRDDLVEYFKFKKGRDSPGETRSSLLVVAALVATTTFQFGVNPPGGVWQENYTPDRNNSTTNNKSHKAGESIWGSTNPIAYGIFMFSNTVGFKLSIPMIYILTTKFPMQLELLLCFSAMYCTYDTAVINVTPAGMRTFVNAATAIFPFIVILAHNLRSHRKWLTKRCMEQQRH